jgi:hypothetical protein
MLEAAKNPHTQRERDPRGKEEFTFTAKLKKCKQSRDKDLLTDLPKKTFKLGWDK